MGSEEEEDSNNNSEETVKFGMVPIGWRAHQRTHTLILLLLLTDFFSSGPRWSEKSSAHKTFNGNYKLSAFRKTSRFIYGFLCFYFLLLSDSFVGHRRCSQQL